MNHCKTITKSKVIITTVKLLLLMIIISIIAAGLGAFSLNSFTFWKEVFAQKTEYISILIHFRLPRILLALLVGGGLSIAGLCLQVLLKNPLAEPYTLGISGGATLGAAIASLIHFSAWFSLSAHTIFALAGSLSIILILYLFMQKITMHYSYSLLMFGIILNAISSALIMLLYSLFSSSQLFAAVHWMMGHIPSLRYKELAIIALFIIGSLVFIYRKSNHINALLLGDENAQTLGVNTDSLKDILFLAAGIITALAVSFTGMIGFIGLIIPHMSRLIWGTDNRMIIITSFLTGGIILLIADTLSRIVLMPRELPVGVITALIGGPYFIYLLRKQL